MLCDFCYISVLGGKAHFDASSALEDPSLQIPLFVSIQCEGMGPRSSISTCEMPFAILQTLGPQCRFTMLGILMLS